MEYHLLNNKIFEDQKINNQKTRHVVDNILLKMAKNIVASYFYSDEHKTMHLALFLDVNYVFTFAIDEKRRDFNDGSFYLNSSCLTDDNIVHKLYISDSIMSRIYNSGIYTEKSYKNLEIILTTIYLENRSKFYTNDLKENDIRDLNITIKNIIKKIENTDRMIFDFCKNKQDKSNSYDYLDITLNINNGNIKKNKV